MRHSSLFLLAAIAVAVPVMAKPAFVSKAKALGINSVTSCASCHVGAPKKGGNMTAMGKYLVDRKAKEKAPEVDVAWLKDFKG